MGVIDLKIVTQTGFKVFNTTEVATFEKATGQDTEPQLNLVEPGAVLGGKVKDMAMARIAQKSSSLDPATEVFGDKGDLAPLGHQTAQVKAPVGVEIVHHPVVTGHLWQLRDHMAQMGHKISAGAGLAQSPQDLTRGHHKRGHQGTGAMTDVLMLAFFRLARGNRLGGVFALENLHAGLFIAADHQATLLQETRGIEI